MEWETPSVRISSSGIMAIPLWDEGYLGVDVDIPTYAPKCRAKAERSGVPKHIGAGRRGPK